MTDTLALFGGPKTIDKTFSRYNPIGREERDAAVRVIESGVLSQFLGEWDPDFYGGPRVQEFEKASADFFGTRHAVTVNSLTSGLTSMLGAVGVAPGDEVIVSPWTMAATATAILHWNAIPVFADIEDRTFTLDPESVEANITPHTTAIVSVDIFGHSADMEALMAIANKHGLKVISDTAQAPGACYKGQMAGTLAHAGGFSLNYHKHIHTGEGGILVTNDDEIAERMQLIRNHAEAVVGPKGVTDLSNMIGYNFRLGEIEAAIGVEQLKKLPRLLSFRQLLAERLTAGIKDLPGLRAPTPQPGCTHAYYAYPMVLDETLAPHRTKIFNALVAEGVPSLAKQYMNLHLLPMYQQKIAYGKHGFPWTSDVCKRDVSYAKGICPVAEDLQERRYLNIGWCLQDMTDSDVDLIIAAFQKVWARMSDLV